MHTQVPSLARSARDTVTLFRREGKRAVDFCLSCPMGGGQPFVKRLKPPRRPASSRGSEKVEDLCYCLGERCGRRTLFVTRRGAQLSRPNWTRKLAPPSKTVVGPQLPRLAHGPQSRLPRSSGASRGSELVDIPI
jgi:hypothetical protein